MRRKRKLYCWYASHINKTWPIKHEIVYFHSRIYFRASSFINFKILVLIYHFFFCRIIVDEVVSQNFSISIIPVNCPPLFRRRRKKIWRFFIKKRKKGRRAIYPSPYFFKILVGRGQLTGIILIEEFSYWVGLKLLDYQVFVFVINLPRSFS